MYKYNYIYTPDLYTYTCIRNRTYVRPSLYMHNDYMPIRGVQGRIHIYNADRARRWGKIVGASPLLVLMSNRPEELVQHVWSIRLISLCGQPDANLRSIADRMRNYVNLPQKLCDAEKLLLPKCIRWQAIGPGFIVDELSIVVRLDTLLARSIAPCDSTPPSALGNSVCRTIYC